MQTLTFHTAGHLQSVTLVTAMTLIRPILVSALHIALLLLIACSVSQATPAEEVSPKVSPSTSASPSASQTSTPVQGVTTTPTPVSSNSTQEIPPCTPLESISVGPLPAGRRTLGESFRWCWGWARPRWMNPGACVGCLKTYRVLIHISWCGARIFPTRSAVPQAIPTGPLRI